MRDYCSLSSSHAFGTGNPTGSGCGRILCLPKDTLYFLAHQKRMTRTAPIAAKAAPTSFGMVIGSTGDAISVVNDHADCGTSRARMSFCIFLSTQKISTNHERGACCHSMPLFRATYSTLPVTQAHGFPFFTVNCLKKAPILMFFSFSPSRVRVRLISISGGAEKVANALNLAGALLFVLATTRAISRELWPIVVESSCC